MLSHFAKPWITLVVLGFCCIFASPTSGQALQEVGSDMAEEVLTKLRDVREGKELRIFPALFFHDDTTKTKLGWKLNNSLRDRLRGLISENPKRYGHIRIVGAEKEEQLTEEFSYKFLVTPSSAEENTQLQDRLKGLVPHYFLTGKYDLRSGKLIVTSLLLKGNPYIKLNSTTEIEVLPKGNYEFKPPAEMLAEWESQNKPIGLHSESYTSQFLDFLFYKKKKQDRNTAANYGITFLAKNNQGQYVASNHLYRKRDYKVQIRLSELATNTYIHLLQFERKRADAPVEVFPIYPLVNSEQQKPFEAPNNLTFPFGGDMELEANTPDLVNFILIATNEPLPAHVQKTFTDADGSYTPKLLEAACQDLLGHLKTLKPESYVLVHKEVNVVNP